MNNNPVQNNPRRVTLCKHAPPGGGVRDDKRGRGGRSTLWAFGWADLAALFELREDQVKRLVKVGAFDPTDLVSVTAFWHERTCMARLRAFGQALSNDVTPKADVVCAFRSACIDVVDIGSTGGLR